MRRLNGEGVARRDVTVAAAMRLARYFSCAICSAVLTSCGDTK